MLELDIIKQQLRLEPEYSDEDDLLTSYSNAARRHIERSTRRKIYETINAEGYAEDPDALLFGEDIQLAMLLLISHWYENREAAVPGVSISELPMGVEVLIHPYRIYGVG
ncbi:head-tail connector protein [Kushneria phosphatilytica]|uniref:Phage gp6-like head-tail connector protein n=1 Tax=Kushneria phosphatilytica TaxID=657387 RepID=A0A1S1NXN2_9GAMM|nr:head-tail connector protein [Kushneria phosphatilytica]OHV13006.1 hypothetical protein BH688_03110 [Kushneria phosphatilytica]QEL10877.1 phage gp6-like head-tail connector protein [Kushneria phosphatilytica]